MLQYVILQNSRHPSNKCSSGDPMTAEGAMCLVLQRPVYVEYSSTFVLLRDLCIYNTRWRMTVCCE